MGDAHHKVSVCAAQRPTFYGAGAVVLRSRNLPMRTGGAHLVFGHDSTPMQLERADDPLPEHEFHAAMLLPAS